MKSVLSFIATGLVLQAVLTGISAQETAVYEGLTYYLNKAEAFEAATVQGKQVLLFWGTHECPRCQQVKKNMAHAELRPILDGNYILWFCHAREHPQGTPDVSDYLPGPETPAGYPALCVIDTTDITKGYGLMYGATFTVYQLYRLLSNYVANDYADDGKRLNSVYVSQHKLVVSGSAAREEIAVYAVTGSQVDKFDKTEQTVTRDASRYPSGILIVAGSSGWARKIIVK
ncbi:MAG: thioredoxin family protein [Tannerella sp.]|nr:thioredoxin family protein [Tannerella sp.]